MFSAPKWTLGAISARQGTFLHRETILVPRHRPTTRKEQGKDAPTRAPRTLQSVSRPAQAGPPGGKPLGSGRPRRHNLTMLAAFLTFAAASALLAMVPGPDTLVMLRSIVLEGLTRWLRSPRFQRRLNGVTGVVLIGFGARLAVEG